MHLKKHFRNQDLRAFFFQDTPFPHTPAVAFKSTADLSIAYSRSAKGVPSYQRRFRTTYRFSRYRSTLILVAPRKFAMFRLPLQRRLVRYRFHIWQIGRPNGGAASQELRMTLTYFCDIDTHLNKNFEKAIYRKLLLLQRRCRAQSYSLECSYGVDDTCDLDLH